MTYGGKLYETLPCRSSGLKANSDNSVSRPTFDALFNPSGILNTFILSGLFEGTNLVRKQVLAEDLLNNEPIFDLMIWRVSCVKALIANKSMTLKLRRLSELPNQYLPRRTYTPPEFPFVGTLSYLPPAISSA